MIQEVSMSNANEPIYPQPDLEAWKKAAAKAAPGGDVSALDWVTPEGLTVKPLYTAADTAALPHTDTLSSGIWSNRIFMSSTESIATPALPTSPVTRGWSES